MGLVRRLFSNRPLHTDAGLLVVRLGAGLSLMLAHGYGKISGGPELWAKLGGSMEHLGIGFAPALWGFLAAFAEFFGSLLVVLGIAFRPAAALVAFTMVVAALHHLSLPADNPAAGWRGASHAIELLSVFGALLLTGPGRYTLLRPFSRDGTRNAGR
jgi:putative oxidoreductase